MTVGTLPYEGSALIYIADDQKFFEANGLNLTIRDYETGLATTEALSKGEVDIATCAEFIIVGKAFKKEQIRNVATIAKNLNEHIIARTDRGIRDVADLNGKRIGVPRNTVAEFYLGRFLDLNGMAIDKVTPVDFLPSELEGALERGAVDAVAVWQPWASEIEKSVPNDKIVWEAQSGQPLYWNIVGVDAWLTDNPELVKRLLASLFQAQEYLQSHPDKGEAIVQSRLKYDDTYMSEIWPEQQTSLTLDQSLITVMEDEARWMITNDLTAEKQVPNFLDYVYEDALMAIRPQAVNIIR